MVTVLRSWLLAVFLYSQVHAVAAPADPSLWPLERKIGQLLMVHDQEIKPEVARDLEIGAILVGPQNEHRKGVNTPAQWREFFSRYGPAWVSDSGTQVPVLFGVDAVHGHALMPGATVFPHNIGLAASGDAELCREIGSATAAEVAATGMNWILAPAVSVTPDARWGRTYEGWGADWNQRAGLAGAFIRGVEESRPGGRRVLTCAKHFIADGQATWGTGTRNGIDQGDVRLSEEELRNLHLPPYREAVEAGVASIMVSYGSWNGLELHHHEFLLTQVLKKELGFTGVVVSDFNGFTEKGQDPGERSVSSLKAGVDLLMVGKNWQAVRDALIRAATSGSLPGKRIDDALRRVLAMKQRLIVPSDAKPVSDDTFGSDKHHDLAKRAAAACFTILKNEGNVLPLQRESKILIAGSKADHTGAQCGGWTINWGGVQTPSDPRLRATPILKAINDLTRPPAHYAPDGTVSDKVLASIDTVIAVVGEMPTAEWFGDSPAPGLTDDDLRLLEKVQGFGKPLVILVVAGRPLELPVTALSAPAIATTWLPGAGGEGVASALFGLTESRAKSPMPWKGLAGEKAP